MFILFKEGSRELDLREDVFFFMALEVGNIVEGTVTGIAKFGVFVELPDKSVGLVHISEVASEYVNDVNDYLKVQDKIKVKVITIDDKGKIALSIKQAQPAAPQEKRQDHFVCANYRSNTGSCSAHFIRAVVLEDLVWMHMRTVISYVSRYEDHFRAVMEQKLRLSSEAAIRGHKKRLAQAEKRLGELDRLFIRIYEDNVAGRITDEKFSMMSKTYEDEQAQLKEEIQTLQQEIEVQERQIENLEQFIQRVRKYEDLDELTPYALRELVKGVYIEAPNKSSGKRRQNIRISYDLVGFIPVDELMKQETA